MTTFDDKLILYIQSEISRIEGEFLDISQQIGVKTVSLEEAQSRQTKLREELSDKVDQKKLKSLLDVTNQIIEKQSELTRAQAEKQYMSYYHSNLLKMLSIHNLTETTMLKISQDEASRKLSAEELNLIIGAQEEERTRLSRQIHDGPAQTVSNMVLSTDLVTRYIDKDLEIAKKELQRLKEAARSTLQDIRAFIFELRPMMLDDLGLIPTLTHYVDLLNERERINIKLKTTGEEIRYKQVIEDLIFRTLQELLVAKLKFGEDEIITLDIHTARNEVNIEINGTFQQHEGQMHETGQFGLNVIDSRINAIGGVFSTNGSDKDHALVKIHLPISIKDIVSN